LEIKIKKFQESFVEEKIKEYYAKKWYSFIFEKSKKLNFVEKKIKWYKKKIILHFVFSDPTLLYESAHSKGRTPKKGSNN
jgi:hypothetical protein